MISVLLADDEPLVRAGVRAVLGADPQIVVVAEAADGQEAVELARAHRPDVALLDVVMPRLDGLSATAEITRSGSGTGVIILTTFSDEDYIARAITGGASGFLLKSGDPQELFRGVRAVADGAAYLSPQIAHHVIRQLGAGGAARMSSAVRARGLIENLTPRERAVLTLVGEGLSNAEIGRCLHVAEGTVKVFVSAILRGLGVRNRVQAAILAYEAGLVTRD